MNIKIRKPIGAQVFMGIPNDCWKTWSLNTI